MLICLLDLRTTAADRDAAVAQLDAEREEIRAMPGNLDFRVYVARDNEEGVSVTHEWADESSFAAPGAGEMQKTFDVVGISLHRSPHHSLWYRAQMIAQSLCVRKDDHRGLFFSFKEPKMLGFRF